jgi:hypothetical protein
VVSGCLAGCSGKGELPPPSGDSSDAGGDASDDGASVDEQSAGDSIGASPDACPGPSQGDLPCAVAQVLEICQNCHQNPPVRGAPFPFLTYEDTQKVYFGAMLRWQRMAQVIEASDPVHMPPRSATDIPQLTDDQLQTLRDWFAACTPPLPEGQGCDKGEAP